MHKLTTTLSFILAFSAQANVDSKIDKIYSYEGYPYKQLISRSDLIKIIYTESNSEIDCSVQLDIDGEIQKIATQKVSKKHFAQKPLASCLPRKIAKQLLAQTFE